MSDASSEVNRPITIELLQEMYNQIANSPGFTPDVLHYHASLKPCPICLELGYVGGLGDTGEEKCSAKVL